MQVYVSRKFKFIYVRQPKSSSTSILAAIKAMFCRNHVCSRNEFTRSLEMVNDSMWEQYFVFTAVRNPWNRIVSAYNMFKLFLRIRNPRNMTVPGPICSIPFTRFTEDVWQLRTTCVIDNCCSYIRAGYNEFKADFVNGHVMQQAHAVFTPDGRSGMDFIARTENISDDWNLIVQSIRARSGRIVQDYAIENVNGVHPKDVPPHLEHKCLPPDVVALALFNETTMRNIALQFAMDVIQLKYLPNLTTQ